MEYTQLFMAEIQLSHVYASCPVCTHVMKIVLKAIPCRYAHNIYSTLHMPYSSDLFFLTCRCSSPVSEPGFGKNGQNAPTFQNRGYLEGVILASLLCNQYKSWGEWNMRGNCSLAWSKGVGCSFGGWFAQGRIPMLNQTLLPTIIFPLMWQWTNESWWWKEKGPDHLLVTS